jgi:hypothetical protein
MDRRSRYRFPLGLKFSYRTLDRRPRFGTGRTLNISSTGLLAESCDLFTVGITVELTMEWPVRLHGWIPLHLVMIGSIVRCELPRFAVASSQLRLTAKGRPSGAQYVTVPIYENQTQERRISIAASDAPRVHPVIAAPPDHELLAAK